MGLRAWWQQKSSERMLAKLAGAHFTSRWNQYKDIDCSERDALANYKTAQRRMAERGKRVGTQFKERVGGIVHQIQVEQANLLWEQGYRHGDHVLVYDPFLASLQEEVVTRFYDEPSLMPPDMAAKFEETQGTRVKAEDRTQRESQPDFSSHEAGWLIPKKLPRSFP